MGVDFNGLEDRILTLLSKDPVKLKIFIDGFDSHALNANEYFNLGFDSSNPSEIIKIKLDKKLNSLYRDPSKPITFACFYFCTYHTIHKNLGIPIEQAKDIVDKFKNLYSVYLAWANKTIEQATTDGYVTCAFGLRLRTPLLKQVILGNSKTPIEASAEGRTAGNALGQSYSLLNNRACSAFMNQVRNSQYKYDIKPVCHIHDAQYYLVRPNIDVINFVNKNLIKEIQWQDDTNIYHDKVKLTGELSLFYPNWSKDNELVIPNNIEPEKLKQLITKHIEEY